MSTTRECGCPPWVVQCAHYDGRIVTNSDCSLLGPSGCETCINPDPPLFWVSEITDWGTCPDCGEPGAWSDAVLWSATPDTLPAARAEFDRRAAQLAGHE